MLLCEHYKSTRATKAQIKLFKGVLVNHVYKWSELDKKTFEKLFMDRVKKVCDVDLSKSTKDFSKYQIEEVIEKTRWIMEELGINIYKDEQDNTN